VEIFHSLEQSPVVLDFEVLEFRTWEDGFYFKIKIVIQDGSVLFAREFYNQNERHFSYHWQSSEGNLLIRWDDAPHHRHLSTFPYHKHIGESVTASLPISLTQVLEEIAQKVLKQ
jgi:hypothetical protein